MCTMGTEQEQGYCGTGVVQLFYKCTYVIQLYWGSTVVLGITVVQANLSNTGVYGYTGSNGVHGDRSSTGIQ